MENIVVNKFRKMFKDLSWQDYVFAFIVVALLVVHFNIISDYKSLPSPLYGGDLYNHLGSMEDLYQGGSIFESGQLKGEIQWVPWLYHLYVVGFAKLTGMSLILAVSYSSLLLWIIGSLLIYFFVSKFFNNKSVAILGVLWLFTFFPILKYSPFAYFIIVPFFYYAVYLFMKDESWKNAILMGVSYGIVGLSNTHSFIAASLFMFLFILYYMYCNYVAVKDVKDIGARLRRYILALRKPAAIFLIGFIIALLWWYKPIFVYHANTINDMQIYGFPELLSLPQMINVVLLALKDVFFNFSSLFYAVYSLSSFIGLILLFFVKNKKVEHKFLILASLAAFMGLFSHFITVPLFHTHLGPKFLFAGAFSITWLLLCLFFINFVLRKSYIKSKYLSHSLLVVVVALFIMPVVAAVERNENGQWIDAARAPLPDYAESTREWILNNTSRDDVFLTTNEGSFALNALTGRKVMTYRRTHASSYADMNQRMLDSALILYSNNDTLRLELIKKYDIKYIYWEPRWLMLEFSFDDSGYVTGFFDPLMIDYTPEREEMLKANNVSYTRINWYLDPAWSSDKFPKRDLLVVTPSQWNMFHPWADSLDPYMVLEKEFLYENQPAARIYKVNAQ